MRQLWTGDNVELLGSLDDASTSLVYLDPPFGSSRSYDAVVSTRRPTSGEHAVHAFDDRWTLGGAHTCTTEVRSTCTAPGDRQGTTSTGAATRAV